MWMEGRIAEIVQYNQYDAFTTYLLWLRLAYFAGLFTPDEYGCEQVRVQEYLEQLINTGNSAHLILYLDEWRRLRSFRK